MGESIDVEIGGVRIKVRAGSDPRHIYEVAGLVVDKLQHIRAMNARVDSYRALVMAAMELADELIRTRETQREIRTEIERTTRELGEVVDGLLSGGPCEPGVVAGDATGSGAEYVSGTPDPAPEESGDHEFAPGTDDVARVASPTSAEVRQRHR